MLGALGSLPAVEGSGRNLDYWETSPGLHHNFSLPTGQFLERTLEGIIETVQIALVSTLLAIIISIVLSIGAARTITHFGYYGQLGCF